MSKNRKASTITMEQPDKERSGTGDRQRAIYRPVKHHTHTPNRIVDEDGTVWTYGYE